VRKASVLNQIFRIDGSSGSTDARRDLADSIVAHRRGPGNAAPTGKEIPTVAGPRSGS
jgi:hypothetical protein